MSVLACDRSSTEPVDGVADAFVLRSIAGDPVPADIVTGESTSIEIVADTMRFNADGRGEEVVITRSVAQGELPGEPEREVRPFQYQVVDGRVEIEFPCPDFLAGNTASCMIPPHYQGALTPNEIRFDVALNYPTPFRFERVRR
jgi:hypothetical protein